MTDTAIVICIAVVGLVLYGLLEAVKRLHVDLDEPVQPAPCRRYVTIYGHEYELEVTYRSGNRHSHYSPARRLLRTYYDEKTGVRVVYEAGGAVRTCEPETWHRWVSPQREEQEA